MIGAVYVFRDLGTGGCVKIGKDTRWPQRLKQARCHTPRGIEVVACWCFDNVTTETLNELRGRAQTGLPRRPGDVREWFDIEAVRAVSLLTERFAREPDWRFPAPKLGPYDDWRSKGMHQWRFRLWLFREDSPEQRLKIIYSCLNDTIYRYSFTYNPFPVYLIAAWELNKSLPAAPHAVAFRDHNVLVKTWARAVARYGRGVPATSIGWLAAGTDPLVLHRELADQGFSSYSLIVPSLTMRALATRPSNHRRRSGRCHLKDA